MKNVKAFSAKNGIIEVEAEAFHFKSDNGSPRDWYVRKSRENIEIENLENHMDGASNGKKFSPTVRKSSWVTRVSGKASI